MANISDAIGSLSLEGDWTDKQKEMFVYVLTSQTYISDYTICLPNSFEETLKDLIECDSLGFSANGRWAFACNLEYLNNWSMSSQERWDFIMKYIEEEHQISYETYLQIRKQLFKDMYNHNLKFVWEFVDMDPCTDWMCSCVGEHNVILEDEEYKLVYTESSADYHDCNLKNYSYYYEYGDELLFEYVQYILNNADEEQIENTVSLIKQHPTWYDIGIYNIYNDEKDISQELLTILKELKYL